MTQRVERVEADNAELRRQLDELRRRLNEGE
jgi:hypothetical protein